MAILHRNPNVGIEYRALVDGEVVRSGSYFGKDAADFLNGISIAVDGGLLSSVTEQSGTTRHHPQSASQRNTPNVFTPAQLEQFKSCLSRMFKVYYKDHKFQSGGEASFQGRSDSRKHWYSLSAIGDFTVRTDQSSYSTAQLKVKRFSVFGGLAGGNVVNGFTDSSNPFVNAIAYDAVLQGSEALGLWVHELGNSLSYITNIDPDRTADAADRYDGDTDAGTAFEDCVFGGRVTKTGILRPR